MISKIIIYYNGSFLVWFFILNVVAECSNLQWLMSQTDMLANDAAVKVVLCGNMTGCLEEPRFANGDFETSVGFGGF